MSARPLRVVRIIARMNIGGPARQVALLQRYLPARGYESVLLTGRAAANEAELAVEEAAGARIERVVLPELGRAPRLADDLRALGRIYRQLRTTQPDIIHTHTAKAGALGRTAALLYNLTRRRHHRAVVVHTFHGHVLRGYFGPVATFGVRTAERALAQVSHRIIAISPSQRHDLVEVLHIVSDRKVVVVRLGLDLDALTAGPVRSDRIRREVGIPDDAIVCGYVGRLVPIKHVDLLIRAFAQARGRRARLLIVGDGECRSDLAQLARDLGMAEAVQFLGWRTDLVDVYGTMDIVALSSRSEGTPVALIEAGAAGKAIVATTVGGVSDVVESGRTGVLVPDDDLPALSTALTRLLADSAWRAELGSAAQASFRRRFGYERLIDDLDAVYRDALVAVRGARIEERP